MVVERGDKRESEHELVGSQSRVRAKMLWVGVLGELGVGGWEGVDPSVVPMYWVQQR